MTIRKAKHPLCLGWLIYWRVAVGVQLMEVIKDVRDLPEWFDIGRYQVFETLSDSELLVQVEERVHAFRYGDSHCDNSFHEQRLKEPYVTWFESWVLNGKTIENKPVASEVVQPISTGRAMMIGEQARKTLNLTDDDLKDKVNTLVLSVLHDDLFDKVVPESPNPGYLHLDVDLSAPDHLILSELKRTLPGIREYLGLPDRGVKYSEAKKKSILENKAIPYMDLTLWANSEGKTIINRVMAAALYPDHTQGEDHIRTTVKKWFKIAIANGFIEDWRAKLNTAS